jgi:DNA-binding NtrC family response regulator
VSPQEHSSEILLLEDDPCVRQVTKEILACEGWEVREAANASEAIDLLSRFHTSIRLVILDLLTPGPVSGVELAERIAREYPSISILLMSGRYLSSTFHSEKNKSPWNFLAKPYVPTDFVHSVRTLLAP